MPRLGTESSFGSPNTLERIAPLPDLPGWRAGITARPRVSIIIPAFNAESTLNECLARIFQSAYEAIEVILVDDGSTDSTRAIAASFPARVVPTEGRVGPAAARNLGARLAEGDILFFIDTDVMLRPDSIDRVVKRFEEGDVDAVCGVQAVCMRHRDLVSQYKNLWMRWTYLRLRGDVPLFYTTAAAILRSRFWEAGGFDPAYGTPSLEDTAFGQKLARLGIRVQVQPDLEVEHVKRYSLAGLLQTDFRRAVALSAIEAAAPRRARGRTTAPCRRPTSRASRWPGSGRWRSLPGWPSGHRRSVPWASSRARL